MRLYGSGFNPNKENNGIIRKARPGVNARGEQLRAGLRALAAEDGGIVDVRGPGLMVASQLADPARVPMVLRHCLEEGHLILMNAGTFGDAIRWMPPLVVSEAEVDQALGAFGKALGATR